MLSTCITRVQFVDNIFQVFEAAKIDFFEIKFPLLFFTFSGESLCNFRDKRVEKLGLFLLLIKAVSGIFLEMLCVPV